MNIDDFVFIVEEYVFAPDEELGERALELKYKTLQFLRENTVVLDFLTMKKVINPEEALMISITK